MLGMTIWQIFLDLSGRDSKGIYILPLIQLIFPYKISCIRVSLEILLLSLLSGLLIYFLMFLGSGCELAVVLLTY